MARKKDKTARFEPTQEEVENILKDMADEDGARGQILSEQSLQMALQGGVLLPDFMGGPMTIAVGPKALRVIVVVDGSGSMAVHASRIRKQFKWLRERFDEFQKLYGLVITMSIVEFNYSHNINPLLKAERVDAIAADYFDNKYNPQGYTALYDAVVLSVLGDAGLGHTWFTDGATGEQSLLVVLTDSYENDSAIYKDPTAIASLLGDLRKTRSRTFGALLFADQFSEPSARQNMLDIGFLDHNIRSIQKGTVLTDDDLIDGFEIISRSVGQKSKQISQGVSAGSSSSVQGTPGEQADSMLFGNN